MLSPRPEQSTVPFPAASSARFDLHRRLKLLGLVTLILILAFIRSLCDLVRFALHSELYSYILLIPFISAYLIRLTCRRRCQETLTSLPDCKRRGNETLTSDPNCRRRRQEALISTSFFLLAIAALTSYLWICHSGRSLQAQDYLALTTLSFLSFLFGLWTLIFPLSTLKRFTFSLAFLIFIIPFPVGLERAFAYFLQHGSANSAYALFRVSGMPVFKEGMAFQLPGFSLQVAHECSGIHSTLVLFITSFLAGQLLLSNVWHRAFLVLAVFPLALLRNGFRIFTLGQLCVHVSPDWINSDLHHRGGPIFFALSLVPFFLLILWLRKQEVKKLKSCTVQ